MSRPLVAVDPVFDPIDLAKQSVYSYLTNGTIPDVPHDTPSAWLRPGAAFVCLKIEGDLRGCIGTFEPSRPNLAEEIIVNSVYAATRDYRFSPLTIEEYPSVKFSVDILEPPKAVAGLEDLDPKKYGVLVQSGARRGLLLPDLEGVDTAADQVSIACQKAGIRPGERVELYRFKVSRYE